MGGRVLRSFSEGGSIPLAPGPKPDADARALVADELDAGLGQGLLDRAQRAGTRIDALFQNVEPTGKRLLLALDVSGSMGAGHAAGTALTPHEAAPTLIADFVRQ